jgi:hypothetical protein
MRSFRKHFKGVSTHGRRRIRQDIKHTQMEIGHGLQLEELDLKLEKIFHEEQSPFDSKLVTYLLMSAKCFQM